MTPTGSKGGSPIFVHTYDLMQWLIPQTLGFPKSQRGVLARQIQWQLFTFYECLVDAARSQDPGPWLHAADGHLVKLRTYVRLSRELNLLTPKQYAYGAERLSEIGRLLGGWMKRAAGHET